MSTVLLLGVSSFAMAQTSTTTSPSTGTAGSATAGHMTEAQIKQKLEKLGYSDIRLKPTTGATGGTTSGSGTSGLTKEEWTGTAMKGGKKVNLAVDSHGMVKQE
jgi:hypothetical protein